MPRSTSDRLAGHAARYRELAEQIAQIGFIQGGSLTRVHNRCGKPNCGCHAAPPRLHGPYWQWTTKKGGKTVTRRLTEKEAELYRQWIDNDRQLRATITEMRQTAAKARELILNTKV